uniref:gliding motility lipoprotein GldD n=1 Tax=Flavobacterium sp. TaxID=239 RepID=UPI00404A77E8
MKKLALFFICIAFVSCKDESIPKPSGQLRLEYPNGDYGSLDTTSAYYSFQVNTLANIKSKNKESLELHYPKMKATVYLTYKPVSNNINNLLRDAQKLTYEHVIKADDILEQPFLNDEKKVYGMFYEVGGDAATNVQFYVTDSTKNFVTGSLYFYAKPNYDSILPAANYIKKDIKILMETLEWKH